MAVNLAEHARKIVDPMERGVVKSWLEHAPFLRMMTIDDIGKEQTEWMIEETLPSVGWRSANEAFTESWAA